MKSIFSIIFMCLFLIGSASILGCDKDIKDPLGSGKTIRTQGQKKDTDNCIKKCDQIYEDSKKTTEDQSKRGKCRQQCF